MIEVIVGTNTSRNSVTVSPNTTLKAVFEMEGIDYSIGTANLDGAGLKAGELNKTFAELGVTEKCFLVSVVKATNN